MIVTRDKKIIIEEEIKGLLLEYGSLYTRQIAKYLNTEEDQVKKKAQILAKKGRIHYNPKDYTVSVRKDVFEDNRLRHCFWIVADLAETIEYHFRGTYPLQLMFYSGAMTYTVYYCPLGKEVTLTHAIENQKGSENDKRIIVIEDLTQMEMIDIKDAVFCTISEKGEVAYYE